MLLSHFIVDRAVSGDEQALALVKALVGKADPGSFTEQEEELIRHYRQLREMLHEEKNG